VERAPDAQGWEFQDKGIIVAMHFPFAIPPLELGEYRWDPTWLRRADFKKNVLEEWKNALNDYCDRIESAALKEGLKRTPRMTEDQHFDWLIRYQVKGESFAAIARTISTPDHPGRRQTVHKAITELAQYLSLTLRQSVNFIADRRKLTGK
jgi:hypothetical protein